MDRQKFYKGALMQGKGAAELLATQDLESVSTTAPGTCTDLLALAECQQLELDLPPSLTYDWMQLFDRTLFDVRPTLLPQVKQYLPPGVCFDDYDCKQGLSARQATSSI